MDIVDLSEEHKSLYFVCLEDWNEEVKEAGNHKELWYNKMQDKGLRVKLALNDKGEAGGMIQYIPVEESFAQGNGLYFINCIWVHGHKKGRGNFQKKGMGRALLQAAEEDVKTLGAQGIAAWGIPLPFWMKASWYKKQGYTRADQQGFLGPVLLWKPFTKSVLPPKWIEQKKKPEKSGKKVTVTALLSGWCPAYNMVFERAKKASSEFSDSVEFRAYDTSDRDTFLEWGVTDALFIDTRQVGFVSKAHVYECFWNNCLFCIKSPKGRFEL